MRILLDTHVLIWHYEANTERLSAAAIETIASPESSLYFSAASIWEMAIKIGKGSLELPLSLPELISLYVRNGIKILPVTALHALTVQTLPDLAEHRDPFDRLIIAQAVSENLAILTADSKFSRYDITRIW